MANETIKKVYAAEQAADNAEKDAQARAEEIIRTAQQKAEEITHTALVNAKNMLNQKISDAKKQTDALSKNNESAIHAEIDKLDSIAKSKQSDVNDAVLKEIL